MGVHYVNNGFYLYTYKMSWRIEPTPPTFEVKKMTSALNSQQVKIKVFFAFA